MRSPKRELVTNFSQCLTRESVIVYKCRNSTAASVAMVHHRPLWPVPKRTRRFVLDPIFLIQQALNGLSFGALLFLVASGFTLVFGLMRISNLAHGGFYLVGAYVAVVTVAATHNFWVGAIAGAASAAVIGLITERGLLRRVRNQEMPEVLVTVGVLIVIADLVLAVFGGNPKSV